MATTEVFDPVPKTPPVPPARVTVVNFEMPFGSMVAFMVKWAIAAIPAILILAILGFFGSAMLAAIFGIATAR